MLQTTSADMTTPIDPLLLLIVILLIVSVIAFLGGLIPYPFGLLVLFAFLIARIIHLSRQR